MIDVLLRIVIYIRVSTLWQAEEGYSLEAQERLLRARCADAGDEVVGVYADRGVSGKDINHRPGLQQLLADAAERKFDVVLVWKLTRLSRSLQDLCNICALFDKYDVSLVSYSESFDARTPSGRMMRNLLGVIAQWEREVISENVSMAMQERAQKGLRTCSYVLGYDAVIGGDLLINAQEAAIVRYIYHHYEACKKLTTVAESCNSLGYRGKRGAKFSPESVACILTNPLYCGFYRFRDYLIRGNFDPIISEDQYNRVQQLLLDRGRHYGRKRIHPVRPITK